MGAVVLGVDNMDTKGAWSVKENHDLFPSY